MSLRITALEAVIILDKRTINFIFIQKVRRGITVSFDNSAIIV